MPSYRCLCISLTNFRESLDEKLTSVIPRKNRHATKPAKFCTSAVHAETTAQINIHVDM